MDKRIALLSERLRDARSKRVLFVSHCILNENTRYLGGAFAKGAVPGLLSRVLDDGIGIVQMKCPEQVAWGGLHKRYLWLSLKSGNAVFEFLKPLLFHLFLIYTRHTYRRLARAAADEIADYAECGYEVVGIVGIDGSPSCGVNSTLDLAASFQYFSSITPDSIQREAMNRTLYRDCLRAGRGIFTSELQRALRSKGMEPKYYSHDLAREMEGGAAQPLRL